MRLDIRKKLNEAASEAFGKTELDELDTESVPIESLYPDQGEASEGISKGIEKVWEKVVEKAAEISLEEGQSFSKVSSNSNR